MSKATHEAFIKQPTLIGKCYIVAKWAMRNVSSATDLRRHFAEIAEELKRLAPEECVDEENER